MSKFTPSEIIKLPLPATFDRVPGCWWRPSEAFVDELAEYLQGKRVLEIFAGNGYLAALLQKRGVQITATSQFSGHDGHQLGMYYPVLEMNAPDAVKHFGNVSDVLLISWPTVTQQAVQASLAWGTGRPIAFVGEVTDYAKNELGGCATDEFFEVTEVISNFETYRGNSFEAAQIREIRANYAGRDI